MSALDKEQLQFFYDEIMGLFGWDDGDEASGVDPLLWVKKEYEIRNVKLAQLRAELDDWKFKHNEIMLPQLDRHGETMDNLRAELDKKDAGMVVLSPDQLKGRVPLPKEWDDIPPLVYFLLNPKEGDE